MSFNDWVESIGGDIAAASALGVSRQIIWCWRKRYSRPTYNHQVRIIRTSGGKVTWNDLRWELEEKPKHRYFGPGVRHAK